jgi:hypothetical protein
MYQNKIFRPAQLKISILNQAKKQWKDTENLIYSGNVHRRRLTRLTSFFFFGGGAVGAEFAAIC